ncbi:hypothetical protein P3S67_014939 [Capsicum chacoense]
MELPESNSSHWKSKFIDGLPMLFVERTRKTHRGPNMSINYEAYIYGNRINIVTQEGLALCNKIKLNQQVKKYLLTERQQLGEFCEQFAIGIPKTSREYHKKKYSEEKKSKKKIEKKGKIKEDYKSNRTYRKIKKTNTCYRCGRFGPFAKNYKLKSKIKSLTIDDDIKDFL